jgi:hypothetical protein
LLQVHGAKETPYSDTIKNNVFLFS